MKFITLPSAIEDRWTDSVSSIDSLPLRDSGGWIEKKHHLLTYFAQMFATAMKPTRRKAKWKHRIYLELFSGPGKCFVRETGAEELGSPLKVIGHEFTRFVFVDINSSAARALETRLHGHPNSEKVEIWNGDCADVIHRLEFPPDSLTFGFIDPTGISHAPFRLIEAMKAKTRCDLLINVQHGMGIKMNLHQYKPDAGEDSALTQFLGDDSWKAIQRRSPREFFREYVDLYRTKLERIGFIHSKNEVLINTKRNVPLYLLLFASAHPLGQDLWDKAVSGSNPQSDFLDLLG